MIKHYLLLIILLTTFNANSQNYWELDSTITFDKISSNNPQIIVQKIIKEDDNEIEKFKKIFSWIVVNIEYDERQIKNNNPYEIKTISKILSKRKGLCGDYASLLDTLCQVAGIKSVKVNGHARNILSNVHDTIYTENHAWNAVKLNNQWFLVDATWASSFTDYDYTRCSKIRENLLEYLFSKYKIKDVYKSNSEKNCETELNELQKIQFYHYNIFNRIAQKVLLLFPFYIIKNNVHRVNSDYFLASPEYFALTHFPADPRWSLLENEFNHNSFRNDSSYFFTKNKDYIKGGRTCYACDSYIKLERSSQLLNSTKNILKNDSLFQFSAWENEFEIGSLAYQKSTLFDDSINKVSNLDSAILSFKNARNHLYGFKRILGKEYTFHKNKNNLKFQLFLTNYNSQKKNIDDFKKLFFSSKRTYNASVNKYTKLIQIISRTETQLLKLQTIKAFKPKKRNQKIIDQLKKEIEVKNQRIDSIKIKMETKKDLAFQLNNELLFSISDKVKSCDSTINTISYACFLRSYLQDNLDKNTIVIQELKKSQINKLIIDSDSLIFKKCNLFFETQKDLYNLFKIKSDLQKKNIKQFIQLIGLEVYSADTLKNYTLNLIEENNQFNEWILCLTYNASRVTKGLQFFSKKVYKLKDIFNREKVIEKRRFQAINEHIKKDKIRNIGLYKLNLTSTANQLNSTLKSKKVFLKELKLIRKNKIVKI